MPRHRLLVMLEVAMMAAAALVLGEIKLFEMPQGGSVSLVMVPIALIAVRRGVLAGVFTGGAVGLLQLFFGGYVVHPVQLLLDYPLAFAALGLSGLIPITRFEKKASRHGAIWGSLLIGALGRFICHFVSGVVWFGEYAPAGTPVALYSFLYNITYLLPEMLIAGIVLTLVLSSAPQLLLPARKRMA